MDNQTEAETETSESRNFEWKPILEGLGFMLLGFVGFLASFWFAAKVKSIVGLATVYGSGLVGHFVCKRFLGDRWPKITWIATLLSALVGLLGTLAAVFLILGDEFM